MPQANAVPQPGYTNHSHGPARTKHTDHDAKVCCWPRHSDIIQNGTELQYQLQWQRKGYTLVLPEESVICIWRTVPYRHCYVDYLNLNRVVIHFFLVSNYLVCYAIYILCTCIDDSIIESMYCLFIVFFASFRFRYFTIAKNDEKQNGITYLRHMYSSILSLWLINQCMMWSLKLHTD